MIFEGIIETERHRSSSTFDDEGGKWHEHRPKSGMIIYL